MIFDELFQTIADKWNELGITFNVKDIPNGGKQFDVGYRGGNFKIRLNDNKLSGATIDWSLVKNDEAEKELKGLLAGIIDGPINKTSLYESDNPDNNVIGCDESGKGDLFGGVVVAAAWIAPSYRDEIKAFGVAVSKTLTDNDCVKKVTELLNMDTVSGVLLNTIEATESKEYIVTKCLSDNKKIATVIVTMEPAMYNAGVQMYGSPEKLIEYAHVVAACNLIKLLAEQKLTEVDDVNVCIDQFLPNISDTNKSSIMDTMSENGFKGSIDNRPSADARVLEVSLASMIARTFYLVEMEMMGTKYGKAFPLGNGASAKKFYEREFEGLSEAELWTYMKIKY